MGILEFINEKISNILKKEKSEISKIDVQSRVQSSLVFSAS